MWTSKQSSRAWVWCSTISFLIHVESISQSVGNPNQTSSPADPSNQRDELSFTLPNGDVLSMIPVPVPFNVLFSNEIHFLGMSFPGNDSIQQGSRYSPSCILSTTDSTFSYCQSYHYSNSSSTFHTILWACGHDGRHDTNHSKRASSLATSPACIGKIGRCRNYRMNTTNRHYQKSNGLIYSLLSNIPSPSCTIANLSVLHPPAHLLFSVAFILYSFPNRISRVRSKLFNPFFINPTCQPIRMNN